MAMSLSMLLFSAINPGMRYQEISENRVYPLADPEKDGWYGNMNYETAGGRMVWMTPDEYLASVRPLKMNDVSRENIEDLKRHIVDGGVLDPLAIYSDGKEDGRHRAYATKELGINRVPVLDYRAALS